jgi:hypothetical protein
MNTLSQVVSIASVASFAVACAGRAPSPTNAARLVLRDCAGQTLTTDAEVQTMAGCTRVEGPLTITGSVTTLQPLASIESVHGTLAVESTEHLDSLDGLERVREVSRLVLTDNAQLNDIAALGSLSAVRSIALKGNPELETLRGLESVRALDKLTIVGNGLYNVRGLGNVTALAELVVAKNRRLIDIHALAGVLDAERIVLVDNRMLGGFGGVLPHLRRAPAFVHVAGNPLSVAETAHLTSSPSSGSRSGFASINSDRAGASREF